MKVTDHEGREVGFLEPLVPGFFGMRYDDELPERSIQDAVGRVHLGWYGWDADGREVGPTASCICPHARPLPHLPCPVPSCHAGEWWRHYVYEPGACWIRVLVDGPLSVDGPGSVHMWAWADATTGDVPSHWA
ncbi:hypothetical protein G4177_06180 [Corallococcus sp. ZKHCc1 1396]|uniref:WG repeat-containing protein n=1 Tax=Corallococcus soli TaxID=2710757 RepID=A0ABR9PIK7_9BACT|nr:hypothetical protein [Corallococcus soli]MBE4747766.1 hypothetical protein [Corallococcus soli]